MRVNTRCINSTRGAASICFGCNLRLAYFYRYIDKRKRGGDRQIEQTETETYLGGGGSKEWPRGWGWGVEATRREKGKISHIHEHADRKGKKRKQRQTNRLGITGVQTVELAGK